MKYKNLLFAFLGGMTLSTSIPAFASTQKSNFLTNNQIEFIKQIDAQFKTNFISLLNIPGSIAIIKSSSIMCGNTTFQKQAIISLGGNQEQSEFVSNKFENLFCK